MLCEENNVWWGFSNAELLIAAIIALLVFGPGKIPAIEKDWGKQ